VARWQVTCHDSRTTFPDPAGDSLRRRTAGNGASRPNGCRGWMGRRTTRARASRAERPPPAPNHLVQIMGERGRPMDRSASSAPATGRGRRGKEPGRAGDSGEAAHCCVEMRGSGCREWERAAGPARTQPRPDGHPGRLLGCAACMWEWGKPCIWFHCCSLLACRCQSGREETSSGRICWQSTTRPAALILSAAGTIVAVVVVVVEEVVHTPAPCMCRAIMKI
jgi:hypothetical protein